MTQTEKILNYLKEHKIATSNELRRTFFIVDVPKAISILVSRGISISTKRNKDNTATYTYNGASTPTVAKKMWVFEGNVAREVDVNTQTSLQI
jgi:hypothetical protein